MTVILVTGMSGTGKSTVLDALQQRGYATVDTDVGSWIEDQRRDDGTGPERQWREDLMDRLITQHETSDTPLFIAGTVWNQARFYPRFDAVVLLSCPLPTMLERLAQRTTNTFGSTAAERERVVADHTNVEPLLRASATHEIDTRRPLSAVVDELVALAATPRHAGHTG